MAFAQRYRKRPSAIKRLKLKKGIRRSGLKISTSRFDKSTSKLRRIARYTKKRRW